MKFEKQRKTKCKKVTNLDAFRSGFQMEDIASPQTAYSRNNAPQLFHLQTHKYAACWPSWVQFWVTGCPLGRAWANSWLVSALKLSVHWEFFLQYPRASCKSSFQLACIHWTTILCSTYTDFSVHWSLWIGKSWRVPSIPPTPTTPRPFFPSLSAFRLLTSDQEVFLEVRYYS